MNEQLKVGLLEEYFTYENLKDSFLVSDYHKKYDYIDTLSVGDTNVMEIDKRFRRIRTKMVIPQAVYEGNKESIEVL